MPRKSYQKQIEENKNIGSSQYDWKNYWSNTAIPFKNSRWIKIVIHLIALYSLQSSFKLLRNIKDINSMIELGGGTGCLSEAIAKKIGLTQKSLTLIDSSSEAKKIWEHMSGFGKYIVGDFTTHNFKGVKFDLVFSAGLIEHWQNDAERLRVIQKHGQLSNKYIMIRVPKKGGLVRLLELREKRVKGGNFEKHYTTQQLRKEVSKAKLKVLGIRKDLLAVVVLAKVKS